jgi:cell volume regulation protein A
MADLWVSLLIAGTILLVGFAASLVFRRYRIPDFFILLLLGAALGQIPIAPFGPSLLPSLQPLLPLFTQLTIAFILFEGGLSLRMHESNGGLVPMLLHILGTVILTIFLVYEAAIHLFGLSTLAALVLAGAMSGPSASIALSFASRMRLGARAESAVILDGVLTNVTAAITVLLALQIYGASGDAGFIPYALQVVEATALALAAGFLWRGLLPRLPEERFLSVASLAAAIVVFSLGQGLLGGNGLVAVFVFGVVLAYRRRERLEAEGLEGVSGEFARPAERLKSFQSEVTFVLRTFFFVYLGLLLTAQLGSLPAYFAGLVIAVLFIVARVPTSFSMGYVMELTRRETRVLFSSVARGMTDVLLLLFAIQSGLLLPSDASFLLSVMPTTVLFSAIACALLLVWAEHSVESTPTMRPTPAPVVPQEPLADTSDPK